MEKAKMNTLSKKFKKYAIDKGRNEQTIYKFDNNYGASVVFHFGTYGYYDNLVELAVLKFEDDNNYYIDYTTEITDDVLGYLNEEDLDWALANIKRL